MRPRQKEAQLQRVLCTARGVVPAEGTGMRILLVSDLHNTLRQLDWTAAVAANFDVVVIAGDLLDVASTVASDVQIIAILDFLKRVSSYTRLIVSSGNEDLDDRDDSGEKVARWMSQVRQIGIPTDGDTILLGSTLVTICPWWDGPNTKRAVQAQIDQDSTKPRESWVWVYHAPPSGSPTCWTAGTLSVTASWPFGSKRTSLTLSLPATSTRHPSSAAAPGLIELARPGFSTAGGKADRHPATSSSIR